MIGKRILAYEIKETLGQGGMGTVYLAVHVTSGEKVAIKALLPELARYEHIRLRFKKEADTMSLLPHSNIVKLIAYKEDQESAYIIMEYIEGYELDNYIKTVSGPMPKDSAVPIMKQILSAVSFAHKNGVIHRDIKPANIFVTKEGQIKITDFGIAKVLTEQDRKLTKTGIQMGTVFYMSPEQVKGKDIDQRSDIYALGVTFFQMVTGRSPYESLNTEYEVYNSIVNDPLPSVTTIYPGALPQFDDIISKATAKNPEQRFNDCNQFSEILSTVSERPKEQPKEQPRPAPAPVPVPAPRKKSRVGLYIGLSILVVAAIIFFWQLSVNSQYNNLVSKANSNVSLQNYDEAISNYYEADRKKDKLFLFSHNEDIHNLVENCYYEKNKKKGDDQLKVSGLPLTDAADAYRSAKTYKSTADIDNRIKLCSILQEALDNKNNGNNTDAVASYDRAIEMAKQMSIGDAIVDNITTERNKITPSVKIIRLWVENNVDQGGTYGIKIHVNMDAYNVKDKACEFAVWFYDSNGNKIYDTNSSYRATDGQVAVSNTFNPGYDVTTYSDWWVFIPYDEIEGSPGFYKIKSGIFLGTTQIGPTTDFVTFYKSDTSNF